jgi:hypothetical protein
MLKKERKLMEDKNKFFEEIQQLKNTLIDQRDKAAHVEKVNRFYEFLNSTSSSHLVVIFL